MNVPRVSDDFYTSFLNFNYNSEAPLIFLKWVALSTIAAAVGRKVFQIWDRKIYTNMYVVLTGPAAARKGTAMKPGISLMRALGLSIAAQNSSKEAFIKSLEDSYLLPDSTQEAHSSTNVMSEELGVFLGTKNQELYLWLTDLYDCPDVWEYKTKNSGETTIIGSWLNLLGGITPSTLALILNNSNMGIGLTSRMVFVYAPHKEKKVALPYKTQADNEMFDILKNDLVAIGTATGEITTSKSFEDVYVPWYEDSPLPFSDERFEGYNERRSLHLRKAAMLFSLSEGNEMILTKTHFDRALELLIETEAVMQYALAGAGDNILLQLQLRIETILQNAYPKGYTLAQLVDAGKHYAVADDVLKILRDLKRLGKVKYDIKEAHDWTRCMVITIKNDA